MVYNYEAGKDSIVSAIFAGHGSRINDLNNTIMRFIVFLVLFFNIVSAFAQDEIILKKTRQPLDFELKILNVRNDTLTYKVFRKIKTIPLKDVHSYYLTQENTRSKVKQRLLYMIRKDTTGRSHFISEPCHPYVVYNNDSVETMKGVRWHPIKGQYNVTMFSKTGDTLKYKPFDIEGYGVECTYYESKRIEDQTVLPEVFAEKLADGPMKLYRYYIVIVVELLIPTYQYKFLIEKPDKNILQIDAEQANNKKKIIKAFFHEFPEIFQNENLDYSDLPQIVKSWNAKKMEQK